VQPLVESARLTLIALFAEALGVVTFIIYMSGILKACSFIFEQSCWYRSSTIVKGLKWDDMPDPDKYKEVQTYLRYEYWIFIVGLAAMPVFMGIKWFINRCFGGLNFRITFLGKYPTTDDSLDKHLFSLWQFQVYFVVILTTLKILASKDEDNKYELKSYAVGMLALGVLNLLWVLIISTVPLTKCYKLDDTFEVFWIRAKKRVNSVVWLFLIQALTNISVFCY
jgi:hypothetical protein